MLEIVNNFLKEINIAQLFAMGIMLWFFYNRLDKKIDKLDEKLTKRIDDLSEKVEDIDKRLCRIEGSLSVHGHCLFNQSKPEQKVG